VHAFNSRQIETGTEKLRTIHETTGNSTKQNLSSSDFVFLSWIVFCGVVTVGLIGDSAGNYSLGNTPVRSSIRTGSGSDRVAVGKKLDSTKGTIH
jgi:hypothetical protein